MAWPKIMQRLFDDSGAASYLKTSILPTSGVTAGSYGPSADASPAHAGTFSVPYVTVDTYGRVTAASTQTITLPSDSNTDTKVTNTLGTTTKFYITGTSSSSTNTGTQYFDTGIYSATTAGRLCATTFQATSDARLKPDRQETYRDLGELKTYEYTLTSDGERHLGLVAQEVEKVIPEAVSTDDDGYKHLDYNAVVAALVAEVNALKARLSALEGGS